MKRTILCLAVLNAVAGSAVTGQTIAITNGRVFPVNGSPVDKATVLIVDGKISAVGQKLTIPAGARKIDATGLSVYPGWIDGFTRVGLVEISSVNATVDTTELGAFNPYAQAWIAVNPHSEMIRTARVNGITTALVAPSGGRISGVASVMNLLGNYPNEMAILKNAGLIVNLPGIGGGRRGGAEGGGGGGEGGADGAARRNAEDLEKLKQYFREAKRYAEMRARAGANAPSSSIDTGLEAMLPVLRRERPIIMAADSYKDIKSCVDFATEMGLKLVIAGGAEAWKHAELLAKNKVAVLYGAVHELPRSADDPYDTAFAAPEVLRRAGVKFAIVTGTSADNRNLPYQAGMAAAYGLEREDALRSITQWPAEILGIDDKVGTIEKGKLANLIVSKGDPLDIRSEIRYIFVEGREVPPTNRNLQMFDEFKAPPPSR